MKQIHFAWWVVVVLAALDSFGSVTDGKAARLEKLKKEFPAHVAGVDVEKMHPVNRECFEQFKRMATAFAPDSLAQDVVAMAGRLDGDRYLNEQAANLTNNVFGSAGRAAAKRNAYWLNERVKPWLRRVANVAQGK